MAEDERGSQPATDSITVEIYDQTYHLRGNDPAYMEKLAAMVDAKMRAVSARGITVDSLRVAVLAALNMADDLTQLERKVLALSGMERADELARARAGRLAELLDSVLADPSGSKEQLRFQESAEPTA